MISKNNMHQTYQSIMVKEVDKNNLQFRNFCDLFSLVMAIHETRSISKSGIPAALYYFEPIQIPGSAALLQQFKSRSAQLELSPSHKDQDAGITTLSFKHREL